MTTAGLAGYGPGMAEMNDPINDLLRETDRCEPGVREFAWVWLEAFRRDAMEVLRAHRSEGRQAAMTDGDIETVRLRTESRLQAARERLLGRLQRLLAWTKDSGRAGDDPHSAPTE